MITKQRTNILLCAGSLIIGGFFYILFRETTYIGRLFGKLYFVQDLRKAFAFLSCDFLKYYLPDYLWCFALGCGLCVIDTASPKSVFIWATVAVSCGFLWEIMQYIGFINGTGDIWDMLMYFVAGISCIIINLRREL